MIQICRLWNLSIASVLALTVSNVLLTVRLLHNSDCQNNAASAVVASHPNNEHADAPPASIVPRAPPLSPAPCISYIISDQTNQSDRPVFSNLNLNLGRWDTRRQYRIFDHAVVGERFIELSQNSTVCLATQSSLEKLFSLVQVANNWAGPMSAAVFAAGNDELYLLQLYITYLRKCYPAIRDQVSFHLAYPRSRPLSQTRSWIDVHSSHFDCSQPSQTLTELLKYRSPETAKWRLKNVYPQNHLRNIARKGCQNDFVFLIDVDIVPSANFAEHINQFLRSNDKKCQSASPCAYVIPTYELDGRVKFPRDKTDLIRLAKKGLARPFHHKVFIYNQFATNISRWEADVLEANKQSIAFNKSAKAAAAPVPVRQDTHISHNVTNFEFFYEPFYVASDLVPPHDERFVGYGFTRNTQVYEMFLAGYQFQVLSPIFTCHWGMQNGKNPAWRERQNSANRKQFEVFKREVFARYQKDPLKMFRGVGAAARKSAKARGCGDQC